MGNTDTNSSFCSFSIPKSRINVLLLVSNCDCGDSEDVLHAECR